MSIMYSVCMCHVYELYITTLSGPGIEHTHTHTHTYIYIYICPYIMSTIVCDRSHVHADPFPLTATKLLGDMRAGRKTTTHLITLMFDVFTSTQCYQPSGIFPETSGILAHFVKISRFRRQKKPCGFRGKTHGSWKTSGMLGITFRGSRLFHDSILYEIQ